MRTILGAAALASLVAGAGATPALAASSPNGNIAGEATITTSGGNGAGVADRLNPANVTDAGGVWNSTTNTGAWLQFNWAAPQKVSTVQLYGTDKAGASIRGGTLEFSDGSKVPVKDIVGDSLYPTTLAFPSRTVNWVKFTADRTAGSGTVGLSEVGVYKTGSVAPQSFKVAAAPNYPRIYSQCKSPVDNGTVQILCQTAGWIVNGSGEVVTYAPGAVRVEGEVMSPSSTQASYIRSGKTGSDKKARFNLDAQTLPFGAFNVRVIAYSADNKPVGKPINLQLFNNNNYATKATATTFAPLPAEVSNMSLVYSEEFKRQVTTSRTGINTLYASAKTDTYGAQEFGDALFADQASGLDNMRVDGDDYLRMTTTKLPAGMKDYNGWGRTNSGAMLASARVGGSGFAAQYGYFEARMLLPAGDGLWSAFWLLPTTNLGGTPTPTTSEIDILEHYGQDPKYNCQTTHEYSNGTDNDSIDCAHKYSTLKQAAEWHTYGAKVSPTEITYFIDGKKVATHPQVKTGGDPMYFMVNQSVGGGWPIVNGTYADKASMFVDYIRVYT